MPRFKSKTRIPRITLWGIDSHHTFNALVFEGRPPDQLIQYHPHQKDLFVLSYCLEGELESAINFKPRLIVEGDVGLINPNHIHFVKPISDDKVKFIIIAFHPSFLSRLTLKPRHSVMIREAEHNLRVRGQSPDKDILPLLFETIVREFEAGGRRITAAIPPLVSILITHICEKNEEKKPVGRAHQIYYHFLEQLEDRIRKTHRVSDYAEMLGMSEKTLNRACQTAAQKSASAIIQEKVNAEAQRFLQYDKSTAKEIAYRIGFSDPVQFSKFFKTHNGISPLEYRKHSRSSRA